MAINKVYRKLPTRYNITEVKFTGDKFSRKRITHEIEKIRTRIPNKRIQVLLPYKNWKPEGGGDPKTYDQFIIYITNPLAYEVLGLQRNDPIPVSFIEKVEKIVKTIAINIIGDVTILSKSKAYRKITLVLANNIRKFFMSEVIVIISFSKVIEGYRTNNLRKYYVYYDKVKVIEGYRTNNLRKYYVYYDKVKVFGTNNLHKYYVYVGETKSGTTKIKKPLIYQENGIKNIVTLYDGKSFKTTTIPELRKLQSKSVYSEWCLISVKKSYKTGIYETLEETYIRIHDERNTFLEESKKLGLSIDLFRHYGSYKKVALWLFELLSKAVPANEPLNSIEA
ncbi:hypothetical protein Glove_91g113 [Diversispora epigaea]|uniref:Uncharacterized protein n=1 Tax=Diversispora epigaea TaxID=1348612 RepID=A0A397JCC4_9GLOM|nr:hypothetical protein Glove_91g113 [Diversispora epigaea]